MSHNEYKSDSCLNCGYQFKDADNYCPECGQANHSLKVPFRHLFLEVLEGTIHLDTKIFKTFKGLILQPGLLTREFNIGKRATYVPPIRIYIFISFIFFMLINLMSGENLVSSEKTEVKHRKKDSGIHLFSINTDIPEGMTKKQYDSLITEGKKKNSAFGRFIMEKAEKLNEGESKKEFSHSFMKNISYLMFFLMPLFAGFVFLFHRKRGHYYYEFLIYSIHIHSFMFLLFSIYLIISKAWDSWYLLLAVWLVSLYYLYKSMKNSFPQSTFSAVWKSASVFMIYSIALGISLISTVLFSFLFI